MGVKVFSEIVGYSDLADHIDGTLAIALFARSSQRFSIFGEHLSVAKLVTDSRIVDAQVNCISSIWASIRALHLYVFLII